MIRWMSLRDVGKPKLMYGDTTVQVGVIPRLVDPYGLQEFSSEKMGFCSNDFRSLPVYSVFLVPCMYCNTVLPIPLFFTAYLCSTSLFCNVLPVSPT